MQPVVKNETSEQLAARVAGMIDHTLLKPAATADQVEALCAEASAYGFASVCVNPTWVPLCARLLAGSQVAVCTVVGFPLGANLPQAKACETELVIAAGASEVDMVINIGALKSGDVQLVQDDIAGVVQAAHRLGALVKVIIETTYLSEAEKIRACQLSQAAGADFVKTSTGFGPSGATVEDIALMRRTVGPEMGIKAAGGIRSAAEAQAMIVAGATRIGASAGVRIVSELKGTS
jgi:deoxyribose-phosphate aldolase